MISYHLVTYEPTVNLKVGLRMMRHRSSKPENDDILVAKIVLGVMCAQFVLAILFVMSTQVFLGIVLGILSVRMAVWCIRVIRAPR